MLEKKVFGINVGVDHIGWTVVDEVNTMILGTGVRLFEVPEVAKEKDTLASVRRGFRSHRKTIRRKRTRMKAIKSLIVRNGILTKKELEQLFNSNDSRSDIYELRTAGLDRLLNNEEFARVLIHIAKHRGYKSSSKAEMLKEVEINESNDNKKKKKEDEAGKVLAALKENAEILNSGMYRTVGEMLYKDEKFTDRKRNKADDYDRMIHRNYIELEVKSLFKAQRGLNNNYATAKFEDKYLQYLLYQKPYSTKELLEERAGYCTLIKGEKRYVKNTYSYELFNALQIVNNLKVDSKPLNKEEREEVIALIYNNKSVSYKQIRKILGIDEDSRFNLLSYGDKEVAAVEKANFFSAKVYHSLKDSICKVSTEVWEDVSKDINNLDTLSYMLSVCKFDVELKKNLTQFDDVVISAIRHLDFNEFGNLSKKAIDRLLPYLKEGLTYSTACEVAGLEPYKFNDIVTCKLPVFPYNVFNNTKAHRIISQFRKVYNALINEYGVPDEVTVVMSREVSMSGADRNSLIGEQKKRQKKNDEFKEKFKENFNYNPSSIELLKYKLWLEQNGQCIYSGEYIPLEVLLMDEYIIDYIIPKELSLNNSLNNMVLCNKETILNKGTKTPYEMLSIESEEAWIIFAERIKDKELKLSDKKKSLLLKRTITQSDIQGFREGHLRDNRNVNAMIFNLIKDNVCGKNSDFKIRIINETFTTFLRKEWRIPNNSDYLYSKYLTSMVAATCTTNFIRNLKVSSNEVLKGNSAFETWIPLPYTHYRDEMLARISNEPNIKMEKLIKKHSLYDVYSNDFLNHIKPVSPSIKVERELNGQIHPSTIRSTKYAKIPLSKLKLADIGYDKETNTATKIYNYSSDKLTYDSIIERLVEFNGNGDKAFSEPFFKISKKGYGSEIKSLKVMVSYNGVDVNGGVTSSANQLRLDVFKGEKGLNLVPVYKHHIGKELPNKAIRSGKWVTVEEKDFMFSLFPKDAIRITRNGVSLIALYKGVDRSSGTVSLTVIEEGKMNDIRISLNKYDSIEKVMLDVLGNVFNIRKENRQNLLNIKPYKHKK